MSSGHNLQDCQVARLDTDFFPVNEYEAALYECYHLRPVLVESLAPEALIPHVAGCDGLIVVSSALPAPVIESLSRCRIISRRGIGTDKIDVDAATRKGILVTNVPWFCENEVADHAMALLLALAHQMPQMSRAMTEGAWSRARELALKRNQRLADRVLGLVGFGRGAQAVARRAKAFGLRLLATRRNLNVGCPKADELGAQMVDLDTLLRESDFVSLHLPLNAQTHHLLDAARLREMKPGAFLINTARGAIVDEMALVAALREGRLAGAGLDTFECIDVFGKDGPPDHPLLELDNVVLTPHVAAESVESQREVARGSIENLIAALSGHWPFAGNIVNPGVVPRFPLADYDASLFER